MLIICSPRQFEASYAAAHSPDFGHNGRHAAASRDSETRGSWETSRFS